MSVAAQGALSMSSLRREASFEMQGTLLPRASVTWEAPLLVNRFERGTAQPLVTLKVDVSLTVCFVSLSFSHRSRSMTASGT